MEQRKKTVIGFRMEETEMWQLNAIEILYCILDQRKDIDGSSKVYRPTWCQC